MRRIFNYHIQPSCNFSVSEIGISNVGGSWRPWYMHGKLKIKLGKLSTLYNAIGLVEMRFRTMEIEE